MGVHTVEQPEISTRTIERRKELPRRRAVVGGFLVALAAVGVFAAYRRAEAPPSTSFLIARSDLEPGQRLTASDVGLVPLDLPPAQAATAYTDPDELAGAVASQAVQADSLLTRGDVRQSMGYTAAEEVSFPMSASHALSGSLQAGERVDVVAVYGTGLEAFTTTVVGDAVVISHGQGDGFAGSDSLTVHLGLSGPDEALAVTHAVTQAEIFLVRSPDTTSSGATYRPPQPVAAPRPGGPTDDAALAGAR